MGNFCQQVLKSLGSYIRVFTVFALLALALSVSAEVTKISTLLLEGCGKSNCQEKCECDIIYSSFDAVYIKLCRGSKDSLDLLSPGSFTGFES